MRQTATIEHRNNSDGNRREPPSLLTAVERLAEEQQLRHAGTVVEPLGALRAIARHVHHSELPATKERNAVPKTTHMHVFKRRKASPATMQGEQKASKQDQTAGFRTTKRGQQTDIGRGGAGPCASHRRCCRFAAAAKFQPDHRRWRPCSADASGSIGQRTTEGSLKAGEQGYETTTRTRRTREPALHGLLHLRESCQQGSA